MHIIKTNEAIQILNVLNAEEHAVSRYRRNYIQDVKTHVNIMAERLYKAKQEIETLNSMGYTEHRKKRIGIYAGSFNPYHIGHANIVDQASKVFDQVLIVQSQNPDKEKPIMLNVPGKTVINIGDELITSVFKNSEHIEYFMVRGLRNGSDLESEKTYMAYINDMRDDIQFAYFVCPPNLAHVSSSAIRGLYPYGLSAYDKYLATCEQEVGCKNK